MIPRVAFVLGNGPTLPVDMLPALDGCFTVGVNRIMRAGIVPTVLIASDHCMLDEVAEPAFNAGALVITCQDGPWPGHKVRAVGGTEAWKLPADPKALNICGSSGTAAARWTRALGCERVYLLGMSGTYENGRSNFYGMNGGHQEVTQEVFAGEMIKLLQSDDCYECADDADLEALASGNRVDQDALRAHIAELIA